MESFLKCFEQITPLGTEQIPYRSSMEENEGMTYFPDLPFGTSMIFAPNLRISANKKNIYRRYTGGVSMCFLQTKKLTLLDFGNENEVLKSGGSLGSRWSSLAVSTRTKTPKTAGPELHLFGTSTEFLHPCSDLTLQSQQKSFLEKEAERSQVFRQFIISFGRVSFSNELDY